MTDAAPAARRGRPRDVSGTRRRELVRAAFGRIASEGFEGLRTRDVAGDVGVNIATLHYYFPTKEALIRAIVGQAVERFTEGLPREGTPAEQLTGHFRAMASLLTDDQELCTVLAEITLRSVRDPFLAALMREMEHSWATILAGLLHRGVEDGSLPKSLDVEAATSLTIAAMKGLTMPMDPGLRAQRVAETMRQLRAALGLDG